jgi:hypothetical protein
MSKDLIFDLKYCLRAEDTTKEAGHSYSDVVFLFPEASSFMGVLHSSSLPDYIEDKKSGGQQQSNLLTASAGNDLRMSTMRPNPYLSAVVKMRKSEFRGFFQLFSRSN